MTANYRKALITGGAGELAGALGRLLLAQGTDLVLLDRDLVGLDARVEALNGAGRCYCHEIDLADFEASETLFRNLAAEHDDIDLLILNAGVDIPQSIDAFDWRIARKHLDINTTANYVALSVFLPQFKRKGAGHVAGIVSLGGLLGLPCEHAYNGSKAAFSMMLDGLRAEMRGTGVNFTSVFPGYLQGRMITDNAFKVNSAHTMDYAAARILKAVFRRKTHLYFPRRVLWQIRLGRLLPTAIADRIAAAQIAFER